MVCKFNEGNKHFDETSEEYKKIALDAAKTIADSGKIVEINTGAISRGFNSSPYPSEELLHVIKDSNSGVCLASDSHKIETLDACFKETKALLKDIGFTKVYNFIDGRFEEEQI